MKLPRWLTLSVLAAVAVSTASAFSGPGHEFVGALAENILVERSKSSDPAEAKRAATALAKARKLLGKLSFADAATIPDELKDFDHRNGEPDAARQARIDRDRARWPKALGDSLAAYHEKNSNSRSPNYHHKIHFTDIAIAGTGPLKYSPTAVGAEPYDIVHTLQFCEQRLRGKVRDDGRGISPNVALVLMIHLVGDLHQPLHVGAEYLDRAGMPVSPTAEDLKAKLALSDVGGNNLNVEKKISAPTQYGPGNLHHAWDADIPARAFEAWRVTIAPTMKKTDDQVPLAALLANVKYAPTGWRPTPATGSVVAPPWENWASEILPLAREAHQHFKIPFAKSQGSGWDAVLKNPAEDYDAAETTAGQRELLLAGWRLAWVLEQVLN